MLAGLESPKDIPRPSRLPPIGGPLHREPPSQEVPTVPQRAGVAAQPIAQSAVPKPVAQKKRTTVDDLDELEDMLEDLEGGSGDDLDDLLDSIGGGAPPKGQDQGRRLAGSAAADPKLDDSGSSSRLTKPNPSASSAHVFPGDGHGDSEPLP